MEYLRETHSGTTAATPRRTKSARCLVDQAFPAAALRRCSAQPLASSLGADPCVLRPRARQGLFREWSTPAQESRSGRVAQPSARTATPRTACKPRCGCVPSQSRSTRWSCEAMTQNAGRSPTSTTGLRACSTCMIARAWQRRARVRSVALPVGWGPRRPSYAHHRVPSRGRSLTVHSE